MRGDARHQVDGATEDLLQLLGEVVDLPPEPDAGRQLVEQVEVARRRRCAAGCRAAADPRLDVSPPDALLLACMAVAGMLVGHDRDTPASFGDTARSALRLLGAGIDEHREGGPAPHG